MTFPKLEKAIRDACPETLELSFGCRVLVDWGDGSVEEVRIDDTLRGNGEDGVYDGSLNIGAKIKRVIGHPPQLHHVLRAIEKVTKGTNNDYFVDTEGGFWVEVVRCGVWWDLTKDLDGQSDETKQFLENIICQ